MILQEWGVSSSKYLFKAKTQFGLRTPLQGLNYGTFPKIRRVNQDEKVPKGKSETKWGPFTMDNMYPPTTENLPSSGSIKVNSFVRKALDNQNTYSSLLFELKNSNSSEFN